MCIDICFSKSFVSTFNNWDNTRYVHHCVGKLQSVEHLSFQSMQSDGMRFFSDSCSCIRMQLQEFHLKAFVKAKAASLLAGLPSAINFRCFVYQFNELSVFRNEVSFSVYFNNSCNITVYINTSQTFSSNTVSFLAALAIPFHEAIQSLFSMSPSVSTKRFLASITPAPDFFHATLLQV